MIKEWNIICYCSSCFHRPKVSKPRPEAPCVTHYTKGNNRKVVLPQTLYSLFLREEMAEGCKSTDWGIPRNREFGQQGQQQFQSPRCLFMVGSFGGTTCVPGMGTEALLGWGPVFCTTHKNGLFHEGHFHFICYFEPNMLLKSKIWPLLSLYYHLQFQHVDRDHYLKFGFVEPAAVCLGSCLVFFCYGGFIFPSLWALWKGEVFNFPLSTELREMVREKEFLDF